MSIDNVVEELERAIKLENQGKHRRALDTLYRLFDSLYRTDRLSECNELLLTIPIERMQTHLLVGLLTITIHHREELSDRAKLVELVRERLNKLAGKRTERLMRGLE